MLHQRRTLPSYQTESITKKVSHKTFQHNYYHDDHKEERRRIYAELSSNSCVVRSWHFFYLRCHKFKTILSFSFRWTESCIHHKEGKQIICLLGVLTLLSWYSILHVLPRSTYDDDLSYYENILPITIPLYDDNNRDLFIVNQNEIANSERQSSIPDYGGLNLTFPSKRIIKHDNNNNDNATRIYKYFDFTIATKCNDVNWRHSYNPNCNFFHETNMGDFDDEQYSSSYINSGFYRDVYLVQQKIMMIDLISSRAPSLSDTSMMDQKVAFKTLRIEHNITRESMNEIFTEALIMERLISSPRIMNIYGHCSTSVATEFMNNEIEYDIVPNDGYVKSQDSLHTNKNNFANISQNKLNITEKLNIAFEMAKSIADLHGFRDGVIVHDDIQLRQWLRKTRNGELVLGDFNRARILRWNDVDKKYCKFRSGTVFGDYRSPEEYNEDALDEKVDIFSFGNNIYALLTGMWPFYEIKNDTLVQEQIKKGNKPNINPIFLERSYEERILVEIMHKCWIHDPSQRVDIFEILLLLKEAVQNSTKNK